MKERYHVEYGGLMRCCLVSLDDAMIAAEVPPRENDTHACKFCGNRIVYRDGAWKWAGPEAVK